ncbi:phage portal protein [Rhizobium sp. BK491]|uniref:phage portal protein n=1 Tax=Rhizobium sp. BK491 TaxID=2587009 RepID=UPI001621AA31|nr:phage portal protein [Rhizobium sp. BK491]MBB3566073.1 HK97 family phage portal protein [Rhizobium sp. BK491]
MNIASVISSAKKAFGFPTAQKAYSLNSPEFADLIGFRPTYSGINIGGQSALYVPAVLQAVRLISETIGSLPCKLYRETPAGKEEAKDHPAYKLVHNRANEEIGAGRLRELLTKHALLYGSGFARVQRTEEGSPFELYRIKYGSTSVYEDDITGFLTYRVSDPDGQRSYSHSDILHVSTFDDVSPLAYGKEAIGLAAILERDGAQFFANGRRPAGIISSDKPQGGDAGATTVINILKSFRKWRDSANSDPLVLDAGWKYDAPAMTSTDAQYLENRIFQIDEIARIFGVPPTLLFELTRGTWSNTEQLGAQFLQLTLRPWLNRWQDAYATCLLTEEERDAGFHFEFVVDDLLRADAAARAEVFGKLISARVLTPNDVRGIINMPPLPGGDDLANPYTSTNNAGPAPAKEAA